jgi:hypothetical protein
MRIQGIDYLLVVVVVVGRCAGGGSGAVLGGHPLVHGSKKKFLLGAKRTRIKLKTIHGSIQHDCRDVVGRRVDRRKAC